MAVLEIEGVCAAYGRGPQVLHEVSLTLEPGEIMGVLGMNGAGKSTLIRTVNGELRPSAGEIRFEGVPLGAQSVARRVREGIVTLPEGHRVLQPLTVHENLELSTLRLGRRRVRSILDERLPLIYELFPILRDRRAQLAGLLSGGEQQMLSLARALVVEPKLLLLDEPSLGLAPALVSRIYDVIPTLAAHGMTLVIVEQSPPRLQKVCSRLIVLREGSITAELQAQKYAEEELHGAYFGEPA